MKTSIYNRLDQIPADELKELVTIWTSLVESRPTPARHDVWGKTLTRACLLLENMSKPTPTQKGVNHAKTTITGY